METTMTTTEKINLIKTLKVEDYLLFTYLPKFDKVEKEYILTCFSTPDSQGNQSLSISRNANFQESMNIEKITNKYISLYSFFMGEKTTVKISIEAITITKIKYNNKNN